MMRVMDDAEVNRINQKRLAYIIVILFVGLFSGYSYGQYAKEVQMTKMIQDAAINGNRIDIGNTKYTIVVYTGIKTNKTAPNIQDELPPLVEVPETITKVYKDIVMPTVSDTPIRIVTIVTPQPTITPNERKR